MKKLLVLLLALLTLVSFTACKGEDIHKKGEGVMTYAEYAAAADGSTVVVETFIQGFESWWNGTITLYTADKDGAYFIYGLACTEEESKALTYGAKIKVTGTKTTYNGEVEIMDAKFEVLEGTYNAEAIDVTDLCGTDKLIEKMNVKGLFKNAKVVASTDAEGNEVAFLYNWNGSGEPHNSDVYFKVEINGTVYSFNVRRYVDGAGTNSDVYKAAEALQIGDVVTLEGFLYWYYADCQARITKITK